LAAQFLGTLEQMHGVAGSILKFSNKREFKRLQVARQLKFLGEDNLKNESAVRNLLQMGKKGRAYYVNAGMKLAILPGVKCTVLGPPTLEQTKAIRSMRSQDGREFWNFSQFWATQNHALLSALRVSTRLPSRRYVGAQRIPPAARDFVSHATQIQADHMLGIVREIDKAMNNTSIILLLEVGKHKLLLPGDAQIENWSYALSNPAWRKLLADTNIFKVGHHGSRNATPKSLWALFGHRGPARAMTTLCSTKSGIHGFARSGTEVPRRPLVEELRKNSNFISTEEAGKDFCRTVEIDLRS
jgi:hypothetical protein